MRLKLFLFMFIFAHSVIAGTPNEEFRATWVITWEYISSSDSPEQIRARIRKILDNHKKGNMNAVLFQVRQSGTAYYNSSFEPWGYYAGYRDPGVDPLAYAIQEAHKRGMELHAWFNVFAASSTHPGAPAAEHPEWICRDQDGIPMSEHIALSPGLEEVRNYTIQVAMEIVRKYDIDGLHLDYIRWNEYTNSPRSKKFAKIAVEKRFLDGMITQEQIEELNTNMAGRYLYDYLHPYNAGVPQGFSSWEEWWRWSVTEFVRVLHDSIQAVKPHVRLSVAALGRYNWGGWQGYGSVYQDAALWFNEGYIEQLTPMHYHWLSGSEFYGMLKGNGYQSWEPWIQTGIQKGRLYSVGPPSYRLEENNIWSRHESIVEYSRRVPWVDGFQFFSYGSWEDYNYWETAKAKFFQRKTKIRATGLIDSLPPDPPQLALQKIDSLNYLITVTPAPSVDENQWFAVYRSENDSLDRDADDIIEIRYGKDNFSVFDRFDGLQDFNGRYTYFATTLDRFWNESEPSNPVQGDSLPSFAPVVLSSDPAQGDTIPANSNIKIVFSKTMLTSSAENSISFNPPVSISQLNWSADGKTLTIIFESQLSPSTAYTLTLNSSLKDINNTPLDGNGDGIPGDDFILNFYTLPNDLNPPFVVQSFPSIETPQHDFPIDGVMTVVFNEPLDESTVNNNTIQLFDSNGLIPSNYKLTPVNEKAVISVQTSDPLNLNAEYTLVLSSQISDTAGNSLPEDLRIDFVTSNVDYQEIKYIDKFLSLSNWEQPNYSGSTVGIVVPNTSFSMSGNAYLPSAPTRQRNSAQLAYQWDENAAEWLLREYASGSDIKNNKFDTTYVLQCYVFGDGSRNQFRFSLREENGGGYPLEVSKWITIDWYGWRIIEWDLSDPNSVGSWLGNEVMDGSKYYFDSFQLTHSPKESDVSGKIYLDNLRLVKKKIQTAVSEDEIKQIPAKFVLRQNYPNPFNPETMIEFAIPAEGNVELAIFDLLGRKIEELVNENLKAGIYKIKFNGSQLPSGIYVYRLRYNAKTLTKRMLLMK